MPIRGTKKTIEALEVFFETGKKPVEQNFFDWMASFYHKDEDISFLINIAKATTTDAQLGENNSRFMTAIRVYQAILWHVRLGKLSLLNQDVQDLITTNINATLAQLMATDDTDNVIDTLGEVIQAFQSFNEEVGGINNLRNRIGSLESLLHEVPNNLRQVQNTFDSLQTQVTNAQNTANTAITNAATAQSTADTATSLANAAQSTANNATSLANAAQGTADDAYGRTSDLYNKLGAFGTGAFNAYNQVDALQNYTYLAVADIQDRLYALENP